MIGLAIKKPFRVVLTTKSALNLAGEVVIE